MNPNSNPIEYCFWICYESVSYYMGRWEYDCSDEVIQTTTEEIAREMFYKKFKNSENVKYNIQKVYKYEINEYEPTLFEEIL